MQTRSAAAKATSSWVASKQEVPSVARSRSNAITDSARGPVLVRDRFICDEHSRLRDRGTRAARRAAVRRARPRSGSGRAGGRCRAGRGAAPGPRPGPSRSRSGKVMFSRSVSSSSRPSDCGQDRELVPTLLAGRACPVEHDDGAGIGLVPSGDEPEQRRLAGARRSGDRDDLSGAECQIHSVQDTACGRAGRERLVDRGQPDDCRMAHARDGAGSVMWRPVRPAA